MDLIAVQTLLIAILVGISCALLGTFLVLRKMSMMIDAISHTVLLGIVLSYMFVRDMSSPWLFIGSTAMGVVTVILIEILVSTKRTTEDAATGAIFPFLFSLAVILITVKFRSTHLDTHAISGNLEFAAYEPLLLFGINLGSKTMIINLVILLMIIAVISLLFKELKLSSFDSSLAKMLGFMPLVLNYVLMTMVSLTAVMSFNAVGSILVVAMMIGPAATSLLISKDLKKALVVSAIIATFNVISGYLGAMILFSGGVNLSSTIATMTLITFLMVWIFQPRKGLLVVVMRKRRQRKEFDLLALLMHIVEHQNTTDASQKLGVSSMRQELNWSTEKYDQILENGVQAGYLVKDNEIISLSAKGQQYYLFKINDLMRDV